MTKEFDVVTKAFYVPFLNWKFRIYCHSSTRLHLIHYLKTLDGKGCYTGKDVTKESYDGSYISKDRTNLREFVSWRKQTFRKSSLTKRRLKVHQRRKHQTLRASKLFSSTTAKLWVTLNRVRLRPHLTLYSEVRLDRDLTRCPSKDYHRLRRTTEGLCCGTQNNLVSRNFRVRYPNIHFRVRYPRGLKHTHTSVHFTRVCKWTHIRMCMLGKVFNGHSFNSSLNFFSSFYFLPFYRFFYTTHIVSSIQSYWCRVFVASSKAFANPKMTIDISVQLISTRSHTNRERINKCIFKQIHGATVEGLEGKVTL